MDNSDLKFPDYPCSECGRIIGHEKKPCDECLRLMDLAQEGWRQRR